MKYDCIIVNGDSYSAVPRKNPHKTYSDFLSDSLGIPVINYAREGSNNKRIVRSTVEYLFDIQSQYQNPLVIIGWSFVRRQEVWYYGTNKELIQRMLDNSESRLITLDFLLNANEATLEQKAMLLPDAQIHKALTDFYTDLYMLSNCLKGQNIDYFWFSAARNTDCPINCFPYINSLKQVSAVTADPNIFKLHDFCIMDWGKENDTDADPVTGHLSPNGHKKFANWLIETLALDR
jgi:hypothetical protein